MHTLCRASRHQGALLTRSWRLLTWKDEATSLFGEPTDASDHVTARQFGEKFGDVCGIVLTVSIERHQDLACGLLHPEKQRRRLAVVSTEMKRLVSGQLLAASSSLCPVSIRYLPSFDENSFIGLSDGATDRSNLRQQRRYIFLFVKEGHNNRNLGAVALDFKAGCVRFRLPQALAPSCRNLA